MLATVPAWVFGRDRDARSFPPPPVPREPQAPPIDDMENRVGQHGTDIYAYETFFYNMRGGVILESGALDGKYLSMSWYFEKALGWRAINVEANPQNYADLVKNRPGSLNLNVALCGESRTLHFAVCPIPPIGACLDRGGLTAISAIYEYMLELDKSNWLQLRGDPNVDSMPLVPCRPAAPLLRLFDINHINVWILDVEGAEEHVVRAFNFSEIIVDVVIAEALSVVPAKDAEVRRLMVERGFDFIGHNANDDVFVRRGFTPCSRAQYELNGCA